MRHLVFCLLLVITACHSPSPEQLSNEGSWQAVSLDGDKIGYRHVHSWRQNDERLTRETMVVTFQQPGSVPRETTTTLTFRESPQGVPLSVVKTLSSNSANHRLSAVRTGNQWRVTADNSERPLQTLAVPEPLLLREGLKQALSKQDGDERALSYYSWSFAQLDFVHFQLEATLQPEGPADRRWRIRRWRTDSPEDVTVSYTTEDFHITEEYAPTSAGELALIECDRDCALSAFSPITHVYRHVIRSPYRIHDGALRGTIRYQLRNTGQLAPPTTDEQRVVAVEDGFEVTVCEDCGDEAPASDGALREALASNYWLDAKHPDIVATIASLAPEHDASPELTMSRLTRFVTQHMDEEADYRGYATAVEALHNKTGDCTEHALLLATLGRAAGIPTRVALGLAYNNERFLGRRFVFVPHAWVQAWVGDRWQSFDSGLGDFNAGYITLGLSQGEQATILDINRQLHRLDITSAVQVKAR